MITTIGKLFNIEYGQKEYHNKERLEGNKGENILISSKGDDNGFYGFFDIENKYKAPIITTPSTGSIGQSFVQKYDCSIDDNCLVLIPKNKIDIETLFQIALQIRINKWKYRYGRQITPERLAEQKIRLVDSKIKYEDFERSLTPKSKGKEEIKENKNIRFFKIKDLCEIEKKKSLPQDAINLGGPIPYITTTSKNNGVSAFTDEEPNFKGKCLSIALNGSVGEVFFQPDNFITSGDNAILKLKSEYNPCLLFYIGALIRNHQWRYNYYRKLNLTKLRKIEVPLPQKNNEIDLDHIERIVKNSYGFDEIKRYI